LQALALMNEISFVEAARKLAERVLQEAGSTPEERLILAFRLVLARTPTTGELQILRAGLTRHLDHFRRQPQAAAKLLAVGESPRDERLDVIELAAYSTTANLVLNLDEAITKQ
jgi:hypothetical protein